MSRPRDTISDMNSSFEPTPPVTQTPQSPEFGGTYPVSLSDALAPSATLTGAKLAAKAKLIASLAHIRQIDAIGAPYAGHLMRTTARAVSINGRLATEDQLDRFDVEAAALLHDTCEDTDVTIEQLLIAGISHDVVEAVTLLTHGKNEQRETYLRRLSGSRLATLVKIADTLDNSDPVRLRAITDPIRRARLTTKYDGQLDFLIASSNGWITRSLI